jgi:hypothetical protein
MQIFPSKNQFRTTPAGMTLLQFLEDNQEHLGLTDALLYNSFPLY